MRIYFTLHGALAHSSFIQKGKKKENDLSWGCQEVMYLFVQCPIKSSKSYLVAHRHVQVIGTEKKKNTQNTSVMVHAE